MHLESSDLTLRCPRTRLANRACLREADEAEDLRRIRLRLLPVALALVLAARFMPAQESRSSDSLDRADAIVAALNRHHQSDFLQDLWPEMKFGERDPLGDQRRRYDVPFVKMMCGTGVHYSFDPDPARRAFADLFAAYGVPVKGDQALPYRGVDCLVDGWNSASQLGFLFVGDLDDTLVDHPVYLAHVPTRRPDRTLIDGVDTDARHLLVVERRDLVRNDGPGDVSSFRTLAIVTSFLDAHTEGPDMDLRSLAFGESWTIDLELLPSRSESPDPPTTTSDEGTSRTMSLRAIVNEVHPVRHLDFSDERSRKHVHYPKPDEPKTLASVRSTRGHVQYIELKWKMRQHAFTADLRSVTSHYEVRQVDVDGAERVFASSRRSFFIPAWFDASRPFTIQFRCSRTDIAPPNGIVVTTASAER